MIKAKEPTAVLAVRKTSNDFYSWKKWYGWFGDEVPSVANPLKVPRSNKSPIIHMIKLYDHYDLNVKPKAKWGVESTTLVHNHHVWCESQIDRMFENRGKAEGWLKSLE